MPIGAPAQRITPPVGAGRPGSWGVQPSGPFVARGKPGGDARAYRRAVVTGEPRADARPLGVLPKPSTLDYAHKLTTTSLVLAGVLGFVLFGPKNPRTVLRRLAKAHVGAG